MDCPETTWSVPHWGYPRAVWARSCAVCRVLERGGWDRNPPGVPASRTRSEGRPRAPSRGSGGSAIGGARGGRPTVPGFQTLPRAPPPARCPAHRGAGPTGRERAPGRRRCLIGCRPRAGRIGAARPAPSPGARGKRPASLLATCRIRHRRPQDFYRDRAF